MAKPYNNNNDIQKELKTQNSSWEQCYYCPMQSFQSSSDFVKHLRDRHCTKEGGSFVCRYGFNGVCPSLPLDGVSDRDYETHVTKYHVNAMSKETQAPEWSVFSAAQNLPAVLNDPSRGKQSNLFTKKWGVDFVEKVSIGTSQHLAPIQWNDFDNYLRKIGKRYRRHQQLNSPPVVETSQPTTPSSHVAQFEGSLSEIPEIFMKPTLDLNNPNTFASVFPSVVETSEESKQSGRLLQEKLSHYLDIVEVKIARQVSQKSAAFFHAMTSQDTIMEEMHCATENVKRLRSQLQAMDANVCRSSLQIMHLARKKNNYQQVLDKLRLMSTVHKTQPMLQLLLGTQDYVAALDLIGTTQEILTQELIGVHCFKHLPMQLDEMEKLIDKMLTNEFERYATADLNRPLTYSNNAASNSNDSEEVEKVMAEDKLVCIVMGLLRKKNFSFIATYKEEAICTIKAIIKQLVIEVIASSDAELCLTGAGEEAQSLSIPDWIELLERATVALLEILNRIKSVTGVMQQTAEAAAGKCGENLSFFDSEVFLSENDFGNVEERLRELLLNVCNYCHERCANLVSTQSLEKSVATVEEITKLSRIVELFSNGSESISGVQSVPLRVACNVQASRSASKFHSERKTKLALLLDSERWKQVDIPNEFQKIIDKISKSDFSLKTGSGMAITNGMTAASPVLLVDGKPYALVGAALLLVQMVSEYCRCAAQLPLVAGYHARNVVDLLRTFNSRSCQLIIGAGALRVAGLKTITSGNLALVSRALQLVLWLLPKVKSHFQQFEPNSIGGYDIIEKDFYGHIKEIESKILVIVSELVSNQLTSWDARPPIPSQSFRNISRHFVKLHEAIAPILPEQQIHAIYRVVHKNFKDKLREQLLRNNIVNNGGPQHGVVTSELTFYMETLRTLKALPADEMRDESLEDIWIK